MTTREGETMNITDPNSIWDFAVKAASDAARPYQVAGIAKRLRVIRATLRKLGEHEIADALDSEIADLEDLT